MHFERRNAFQNAKNYIFSRKKYVCLPYQQFSDPLPERHIYFFLFDLKLKIIAIIPRRTKGLVASVCVCSNVSKRPRSPVVVTCLNTDACLIADPGAASSIPAPLHTFMEIDHEIISTAILFPSAEKFKKCCCHI